LEVFEILLQFPCEDRCRVSRKRDQHRSLVAAGDGIPGQRCAEARGPKALVSPELEARVDRNTPNA
jgi:hypothetical protein